MRLPRYDLGPWRLVRMALYAGLAVVGAVLTARYNSQFSQEQGGFEVGAYIEAGFVNGASSSFTVDVAITAAAALLFMAVEGWRLRIRLTPVLMVSTFVLAIAFSFPAFLVLRELRLARRPPDPPPADDDDRVPARTSSTQPTAPTTRPDR